jgi:hypothetical protein
VELPEGEGGFLVDGLLYGSYYSQNFTLAEAWNMTSEESEFFSHSPIPQMPAAECSSEWVTFEWDGRELHRDGYENCTDAVQRFLEGEELLGSWEEGCNGTEAIGLSDTETLSSPGLLGSHAFFPRTDGQVLESRVSSYAAEIAAARSAADALEVALAEARNESLAVAAAAQDARTRAGQAQDDSRTGLLLTIVGIIGGTILTIAGTLCICAMVKNMGRAGMMATMVPSAMAARAFDKLEDDLRMTIFAGAGTGVVVTGLGIFATLVVASVGWNLLSNLFPCCAHQSVRRSVALLALAWTLCAIGSMFAHWYAFPQGTEIALITWNIICAIVIVAATGWLVKMFCCRTVKERAEETRVMLQSIELVPGPPVSWADFCEAIKGCLDVCSVPAPPTVAIKGIISFYDVEAGEISYSDEMGLVHEYCHHAIVSKYQKAAQIKHEGAAEKLMEYYRSNSKFRAEAFLMTLSQELSLGQPAERLKARVVHFCNPLIDANGTYRKPGGWDIEVSRGVSAMRMLREEYRLLRERGYPRIRQNVSGSREFRMGAGLLTRSVFQATAETFRHELHHVLCEEVWPAADESRGEEFARLLDRDTPWEEVLRWAHSQGDMGPPPALWHAGYALEASGESNPRLMVIDKSNALLVDDAQEGKVGVNKDGSMVWYDVERSEENIAALTSVPGRWREKIFPPASTADAEMKSAALAAAAPSDAWSDIDPNPATPSPSLSLPPSSGRGSRLEKEPSRGRRNPREVPNDLKSILARVQSLEDERSSLRRQVQSLESRLKAVEAEHRDLQRRVAAMEGRPAPPAPDPVCSDCGAEFSDDAMYCHKCGARRGGGGTPQAQRPPRAKTPPPEEPLGSGSRGGDRRRGGRRRGGGATADDGPAERKEPGGRGAGGARSQAAKAQERRERALQDGIAMANGYQPPKVSLFFSGGEPNWWGMITRDEREAIRQRWASGEDIRQGIVNGLGVNAGFNPGPIRQSFQRYSPQEIRENTFVGAPHERREADVRLLPAKFSPEDAAAVDQYKHLVSLPEKDRITVYQGLGARVSEPSVARGSRASSPPARGNSKKAWAAMSREQREAEKGRVGPALRNLLERSTAAKPVEKETLLTRIAGSYSESAANSWLTDRVRDGTLVQSGARYWLRE